MTIVIVKVTSRQLIPILDGGSISSDLWYLHITIGAPQIAIAAPVNRIKRHSNFVVDTINSLPPRCSCVNGSPAKRARRRQGSDYNRLSLDRNVTIKDRKKSHSPDQESDYKFKELWTIQHVDETSRFGVGEGKKPKPINVDGTVYLTRGWYVEDWVWGFGGRGN